jgi:hypothetical protein
VRRASGAGGRHIDLARVFLGVGDSSGIDATGSDGFTSATIGTRMTPAIGAMSRRKTKFSLV